jgi:hypothetical protein
MAKHKLASIRITPGKNGGHTVQHEFAPEATSTKGMNGGIYNAAPPSETHTFGPGDHSGLLKHITSALALKGLQQQSAGAGKQPNPLEE